ncbi:MAG: protein kinase, partial [Aquificales bacterium]|nr:protein kinase [Aquificales bacterium]
MKQLIGQQIGQYQVEALLGEGGMGAVYRAHDLKHGRMVALKIMLANLSNKPQFRSRFMQEAEAIAHFSSPAIIAIFDTGTYEESPYIVMEYIEGGSLIDYMRQLDWSGAKPTVETVTTVAAQVAEGLSYAHQRGLIHRDVKPGNVLLKMREGAYQPRQTVISDFGLAIQHKDGDEMDTAPFMGSLAYMSPEQCENKPLDGRSDIYALGILLYQLATGQLPFQINAPADIMKHLNETPLPPSLINPSLPEILETITLKAIEKKPGDRYQSAAEMAHALRQALANPELQTAVLAQTSSNVVTQWLDNKWIAAIDVADRVDIHQTWTSLGKNRLFIVHQYEESQVIGLDEDEITIGREAGNNVVLDDQSVSGKHIRLLRTPQGWSVSDLGSTNHSYLGERMLEYEQVYDWPSNEALRMGPYFLRWQPFAADHRQKVAPILAGAALAGAAVAGAALLTSDPEPDPLSAAAAGDPDLTPEYSDGEVLGIAITPPTLELDPEAQSLLELSITNRDVTVKDVTMRLEENGRPPTWVSLTDYHMKLLPDETKSTTALVDLSQAPTILADLHVIKLIATTDKGEVEITDVQVTVNSQEEFTLDMHPSNLQEKVTCRLTISDQSNFQNEYTIMGIDDSDALIFEFDEPQNAILT